MTIYGWDVVPASVAMPISGGTVNSAAFPVPKNMLSMAIHVPALVGTTTVKIQALAPDSDQASEVWTDVSVFNPADGSLVALDGIAESAVTVIPIAATGGGVLRFVATNDQSSVPSTIKVTFV